MFAQLSRSRHTEPKINGPSRGRSTYLVRDRVKTKAQPLCKVLQALGTVVATATAAAIQFKFPCQQWTFPKPLLLTFLLWTWRPISFRKQLQSVYVYVSAIATPM